MDLTRQPISLFEDCQAFYAPRQRLKLAIALAQAFLGATNDAKGNVGKAV